MSLDLAIVFVASVVTTFNPRPLAAVNVLMVLPDPKRLMLGYWLGWFRGHL